MRILLDVDGVIADWTGAVAGRIFEYGGGTMDRTKWFRDSDLPPNVRTRVMMALAEPNFCFKFDPLPGALEAIKELRAAGCEVQFVTAIWDSPTWVYDRNRWLRKHKLISGTSGVTYTKDKHLVKGDIFVDDKISNVEHWKAAWPNGIAVLWAQPWNANQLFNVGIQRFNDWSRLVSLARTMGEKIAA